MPFPFDPSPSVLWTLTREGKLAACEIAFVPNGVQATVLRNGQRLYSRVFPTGDETLEWVEQERNNHLATGWIR